MVELSLPRNSRPTKGKAYAAPEGAKNVKRFHIYRYDPDSDAIRASIPMTWTWTAADPWCWTRS